MAIIAEKRVATTRPRKSRRSVVLVPLVIVLALFAALAAGQWVYADRALPGLSVAGVDVGSLAEPEIRERLQTDVGRPWAAASVAASFDGQTWRTTNGELGIAPDIDGAVHDTLSYGKQGSIPDRLSAWIAAQSGEARVGFAMRATGIATEAWVAQIGRDVNRPVRDGALALTDQGIAFTAPIIGRELDVRRTIATLLTPQTLHSREFPLAVRLSYPAVDDPGIREAATAAGAATTALRVTAGDREVSEDAAGLATLLVIDKQVAAAAELPSLPNDAIAPAARYRYRVSLNEAKVRDWITAVAETLDRPARNASYRVNQDNTLAVIPSVTGLRIDQARLLADVRATIFTPTAAARQIAAAFVTEAPIFTTEQAAKYTAGMVRISSFSTWYPANASRHANITTGALQFDKQVVAPGETFSFWDNLGPVTVERGYAYAGAIINNRSDENVIGGGLCQVSTTLFNAVARAGYDIVERYEHGYYIDRYPLGFDAAVFLPGADFRWRNDTAYPVLIRAYPAATSIAFELFSIPSGRTVILGDPIETNLTMPAKDQAADPAYPPGVVVQGRDVSRSWTVYENGRIIRAQTFFSHHVPVWGGPAR